VTLNSLAGLPLFFVDFTGQSGSIPAWQQGALGNQQRQHFYAWLKLKLDNN